MPKCVTDVSPIAGKGRHKRAALSPAYLQSVTGVCQRQTSLTQAQFCSSYNTRWRRKAAQLLGRLGFILPLNAACWLTGTAALLQALCGALQEHEQSFLRRNSIKNTSDLKSLHPRLNTNLPKVQGCSDLRFMSLETLEIHLLCAEKNRKQRPCNPPGPFLRLSWLVRERLFWLQAQTGGTFLCSLVTAFSLEHLTPWQEAVPTCKLSLGPADGNPGGWINGVSGSSALEGSLLEASFLHWGSYVG